MPRICLFRTLSGTRTARLVREFVSRAVGGNRGKSSSATALCPDYGAGEITGTCVVDEGTYAFEVSRVFSFIHGSPLPREGAVEYLQQMKHMYECSTIPSHAVFRTQ